MLKVRIEMDPRDEIYPSILRTALPINVELEQLPGVGHLIALYAFIDPEYLHKALTVTSVSLAKTTTDTKARARRVNTVSRLVFPKNKAEDDNVDVIIQVSY